MTSKKKRKLEDEAEATGNEETSSPARKRQRVTLEAPRESSTFRRCVRANRHFQLGDYGEMTFSWLFVPLLALADDRPGKVVVADRLGARFRRDASNVIREFADLLPAEVQVEGLWARVVARVKEQVGLWKDARGPELGWTSSGYLNWRRQEEVFTDRLMAEPDFEVLAAWARCRHVWFQGGYRNLSPEGRVRASAVRAEVVEKTPPGVKGGW
jgi:hypothetical protein